MDMVNIEGEIDPWTITDADCVHIDEERGRRALVNKSRAKKGSPHKVYPAAMAERDFARKYDGHMIDPLLPRAGGKVDVRLRDGREFDVKNQREMSLSKEDDDTIWTYFAQHDKMVAPGWKQAGIPFRPYCEVFGYGRDNLVIRASDLP